MARRGRKPQMPRIRPRFAIPKDFVKRKCLRCKRDFSTDQDYRICPNCKNNNYNGMGVIGGGTKWSGRVSHR
jgi:hypothetical protein